MRNKKFFKTLLIIFTLAFIVIGPFAFTYVQAQGIPATPATTGCGIWNISACIANVIMLPLVFSSWILGIVGVLLNAVLQFTVWDLAKNITAITGINIAWGVIRDLANILFIFLLLYSAIQTILGIGGKKVKDILVGVVIAAVLINFSLFFTKLIVDASNVVALTFYQSIAPNAGGSITNSGLSNSFMQPLGLSGFFNLGAGSQMLAQVANNNLWSVTIISIGGTIFLIVASFVFLAVSIMFIIRFVTIVFLLILSPIGIAGLGMPSLKGVSGKWWNSLADQAMFAPIYMVLTWVVLTIFNSPGFLGLNPTTGGPNPVNTLGQITSGSGSLPAGQLGSFGLVMNFIIIIVMAIATLVIAKQVAKQSGTVGQKIVGAALGFGVGAVGSAGRRFVGGYSRSLADDEKLKEKAKEDSLGGLRARLLLKAGQRGASATFDARNSKALGTVGGAVGFDVNKEFGLGKAGGKGGYDARIKEVAERHEKFAKSLAPTDVVKEQAQRNLDAEKGVVLTAEKDLKAHEERLKQQQEFAAKETDPTRKSQYEAGIQRLEKEREEKQKNLEKLKASSKERIAEAKTEVDRLKGVDEDEAKKRVADELGISVKQLNEKIKSDKSLKEKVEKTKVKSAADVRKEGYADTITSPVTGRFGIGINETPFGRIVNKGKPVISRANRVAAANLRKGGGKKVEDIVKDAMKKTGEIKEDEESEESKPETPSAPEAGGSAPKP